MATNQRGRRALARRKQATTIDATIRFTVPSEKHREFLQTFRAILDPIRQEQGCLSCNCYMDIEAENTLFFREEWRTREDLENHLRSVIFCVLTGAMSLLGSPAEIRLYTIDSIIGGKELQTLRSSSTTERSGGDPTDHWQLHGKVPQQS